MFKYLLDKLISKKPVNEQPVMENKPAPLVEIISLQDLLTSSGKYPDRANHPECTDEVKANGKRLLNAVNALLRDLNIQKVSVSSGFRTSAVNASIANAAKKSLHMVGMAIDLVDKDGSLDKLIASRPDLLKKHALWIESPDHTPGWCHLDLSSTRTDRPSRMFNP